MKKKTRKIEDDKSFLEIDEYNLDRELKRQPKLTESYARQVADARRDHEVAKNTLKVIEAEIDTAVRRDPDKYGLMKVTEGAIDRIMVLQDEHKDALFEVNETRHRMDVLAAVLSGIEDKKDSISGLIKLHGQQYFSEPLVKGPGREAMEDLSKRNARRKKTRRD